MIIVLGLMILASSLNAQTDFRPGYIVKASGDTIFGQIDYRGDLLMSSVCRFKGSDSTIIEYSPFDIVGFRFIDSKYFISEKINEKKVFLEYLIKGKVNIYYMRDDNGDHYFLDKEGLGLIELPYQEGIKYVDGKQVFFETKLHIGILNYYMQDAPEIQNQIQTIKKPGHQYLIQLAEDYHNAVCLDEKCIIYAKSIPFIKILPEITFGVTIYSNVEDLENKIYIQPGLIGHLWMPRSSEKMYFRTGMLFSRLDYGTIKCNYFKIPCQLEYINPKGIFKPRIAYGFNFYIPGYYSVSLNVGGNLKLSEQLYLGATTDFEFNPTMLIIPKSYLANSLQIGLYLKI